MACCATPHLDRTTGNAARDVTGAGRNFDGCRLRAAPTDVPLNLPLNGAGLNPINLLDLISNEDAMLNEHLEHHVTQRLVDDPDLSSQRIQVSADHGIITLSGHVQSFRKKLAASCIASADKHVVSVVNKISVAPHLDADDATIAFQVNLSLRNLSQLSEQTIRVDAKGGVVTLTGYVAADLDKQQAADFASGVDGVKGISNLLIVNIDEVQKNRLHCEAILAAISDVIGMENEQLMLSIVNETAKISGTVDSLWKRDEAESVARQFEILTVCNDICVELPKPGIE